MFNDSFNDYEATKIRGDTVEVYFDFTTIVGDPADYTIYFYGKKQPNDLDSAALFKKTSTDGSITVDPVTKRVTVVIASSDTATFVNKTVVFCEMQLVKNGETKTVDGSRGKITFLVDLVRA